MENKTTVVHVSVRKFHGQDIELKGRCEQHQSPTNVAVELFNAHNTEWRRANRVRGQLTYVYEGEHYSPTNHTYTGWFGIEVGGGFVPDWRVRVTVVPD